MNICSLIKDLRSYEPDIVKLIFDFVFVPYYDDKKTKCKYIRVIPYPGSNKTTDEGFGNK